MRTGKISLKHYLCQRGVPDITDGDCRCGRGGRTTRHVLLACSLFNHLREKTFGRRNGGSGEGNNRQF
ncbi:hypothetical protein DPV78_004255 [Talaromyces pinophilus]|nr:hypothetical protein DPV78_004255 [Talaromyces pinophilus]